MKKQTICLNCKKELLGRVDKKFCDVHCKSAHHYRLRQENMSFYSEVEQQLKLNRKILKVSNKAGKATIRSEVYLSRDLILISSLITGRTKKVRYISLCINMAS